MRKFLYKIIPCILVAGIPVYIPLIIYLFYIKPYISGDLDALSMIPFPKEYVKQDLNFKKKFIDCNYNEIPSDSCILVIGDSFSQSWDGTTTTYVNYLAEKSNLPIYNLVSDWGENSIYRFLHIARKEKLPPIVIIESVEREIKQRFEGTNVNISNAQLDSIVDSWGSSNEKINDSNIKKSQELIRKRFFKHDSGVKTLSLKYPLFSLDKEKSYQLFIYNGDLDFVFDTINYTKIISTLKEASTIAKEQKCEIFFLIAADKYDVYYPYIKNNPYPINNTLDSIIYKTNGFNIINSKDTLSIMIEEGVKDVYWCNNTHWSPIGSKAVGEFVSQRIKTRLISQE